MWSQTSSTRPVSIALFRELPQLLERGQSLLDERGGNLWNGSTGPQGRFNDSAKRRSAAVNGSGELVS